MTTILYFEDIVEGAVEWRGKADVDKEEMVAYAKMNDPWPVHIDEHNAKQTSFGSLTASGGYAITLWYRLSHPILNNRPQRMALIAGVDWHVKFRRPIRAGDQLRFRTTVLGKRPSSTPGRGVVISLGELINQDNEAVLSIEAAYLVATRQHRTPSEHTPDPQDTA